MLEAFRTAAGDPAFSYNGRLLCSKVAPFKEAQNFVEKHKESLEFAQTVYLLGLGGGHVVQQLRQTYPLLKIIVIECNGEIIAGVSNCFTFSLMNVEIIQTDSVQSLKKNIHIRSALDGKYCVLKQPSSQWLHSEFYSGVEELLTGRTPDAFTFLLSVRDDVREALRPLVEVGGPATIKTLNQNLNRQTTGERAKVKLLIKALRELVI